MKKLGTWHYLRIFIGHNQIMYLLIQDIFFLIVLTAK